MREPLADRIDDVVRAVQFGDLAKVEQHLEEGLAAGVSIFTLIIVSSF